MARNNEIRELAKKSKVKLWQIADCLGISDVAFSKKLRKEITGEEKKRIIELIKNISELTDLIY